MRQSDHIEFHRKTSEALARIEEKCDAHALYLSNIDKAQQDHKKDQEAHGVTGKIYRTVFSVIGGVGLIMGIILTAVRLGI